MLCYDEDTMKETTSSILPNSTQVPNVVLDEWMPRLSDPEFRILLVVVRQTLGWIEDVETKRRKEKDWISHSQLAMKTGKSSASITRGIKALIEDHHLIEALDEKGKQLDTAEKRLKMGAGGRIFYRLNIHAPEPTLFDKPRLKKAVKKPHQKDEGIEKPHQKKHPHNDVLQKKPIYTKGSIHTMQPDEPVARSQKPKSDHKAFVEFWDSTVKATRGIKPIYTGADMRNLKRILSLGIKETDLEQIALFFLADYSFKKFSPSISTLTSVGIINGIRNRMTQGNDAEFWKNLDSYADRYLPRTAPTPEAPQPYRPYSEEPQSTRMTSMADAMAKLMDRYNQNTLEKSTV